MDMVHELGLKAANFAKLAYNLQEVLDEKYSARSRVEAIIFDNLRPDEAALEEAMSKAESSKEKLCCVLHSYQNNILTLRDFLEAALHENEQAEEEVMIVMGELVGTLVHTLDWISEMRQKLDDTGMPSSLYSGDLEKEMTVAVEEYLKQSSATDIVYAVRNYAVAEEVMVCADDLILHIKEIFTGRVDAYTNE